MKITNLFILAISILFLSCCDVNYEICRIYVKNKTHQDLHFIYKNEDKTYISSTSNLDSSSIYDFGEFAFDTICSNRSKVLNDSEFKDIISRIKLYYIQNGDTFNVKKEFYDGKSCWKAFHSIEHAGMGITFEKHWESEYTATLTDSLFEKK